MTVQLHTAAGRNDTDPEMKLIRATRADGSARADAGRNRAPATVPTRRRVNQWEDISGLLVCDAGEHGPACFKKRAQVHRSSVAGEGAELAVGVGQPVEVDRGVGTGVEAPAEAAGELPIP